MKAWKWSHSLIARSRIDRHLFLLAAFVCRQQAIGAMPEFLHNPDGPILLGPYLAEHLRNPRWTLFSAAVAFTKYSGVRHIEGPLREFVARGSSVRMSVGVDLHGTSREGLQGLMRVVGSSNEIWVFHNEGGPTFHPKIYAFSNEEGADILVGSGNLTESGLFTNYEAALQLRLDLKDTADQAIFHRVMGVLDRWADPVPGTARRLTPEFLQDLLDHDYVRHEAHSRSIDSRSDGASEPDENQAGLFTGVPVRRPPGTPRGEALPIRGARTGAVGGIRNHFVMVLQRTDVGTGQTTPGTSPRSPEVFVPLRALNAEPGFWGFPDQFVEDAQHEGKLDRHGVPFLFEGEVIEVNMFRNPDKHDFRLRNSDLRASPDIGDILHIQRADRAAGCEYVAEVIRRDTPEYVEYDGRCDQPVPSSRKRFGYY